MSDTKIQIGTKTYPGDVEGMMKHREMSKLLHEVAVSKHSPQHTAFLNALFTGKKIAILYNAFIKEGSQFEINISSDLRKDMTRMGAEADWSNPDWKQKLNQARAMSIMHVRDNILDDFFTSETFRKFVFSKTGSPQKAAKLLGIRDHKALGDVIIAQILEKPGNAKKKMEKLAKKEKLKDKADAVMKVLANAGFVQA